MCVCVCVCVCVVQICTHFQFNEDIIYYDGIVRKYVSGQTLLHCIYCYICFCCCFAILRPVISIVFVFAVYFFCSCIESLAMHLGLVLLFSIRISIGVQSSWYCTLNKHTKGIATRGARPRELGVVHVHKLFCAMRMYSHFHRLCSAGGHWKALCYSLIGQYQRHMNTQPPGCYSKRCHRNSLDPNKRHHTYLPIVVVDHDVVWFDVSVHDSHAVTVVECP